MSPAPVTPRRRGVTRLTGAAEAAAYATERSSTSAPIPSGHPSAPSGHSLTEPVEVLADPSGVPVRVQWHSRWYVVLGEPARWFQRRAWWLETSRAERGRQGLVSHKIWRLELRLEAAPAAQSRTVDVVHDVHSGRWRVVRVHE
ncbi:hypothetical protein [Nesterenkonia alkaliphila]|uniref:hypothetical protein n=1 Tax=Nesterenkonia alkaliphila TaxID=1463631 RepID=UPI0019C83EF4|nr:hypothetical protein [Nesterenkonia alkaliphila]GFZ97989.1 hypothetical protein GCM10011359_28990 [Nesterenkonia alkaliphila]